MLMVKVVKIMIKLVWGSTREGEDLGTFNGSDTDTIWKRIQEKLEELNFKSHYMRSWTDPVTGDKLYDYGSHTNFFWVIHE